MSTKLTEKICHIEVCYLSNAVDEDILPGGKGKDTLLGGNGKDELFGADGDDSLAGEVNQT